MFFRRALIPILLCVGLVPLGHTLALALVAGVVAIVSAVRAGFEPRIRHEGGIRRAWSKPATYAVLCVLALAITTASRQLARYRANQIVAAVERYRSDHGEYPECLTQLVPQYMEAIPPASYSFFGDFSYHKDRGEGGAAVSFYYITLPPFDGPTYQFDRGRWSDERD